MKISAKSIVSKLVRKSKLSKNASEVTLDTLATSKPEEDDCVAENTYHESFSSIETGIQYDADVCDDDASAPNILSDDEVRGLFCLWNDALSTLNPDTVASRYSSKPCLLPTVSDIPRTDFHSIKDYFVHFLEKKPHGTILESFVTTGPGWCMDNGIYEFSLQATGDTVKARYSFVYTKEGDDWKISHHHSSQMPEEIVPKTSLLNNIVDDLMLGLVFGV
ncbi:unnamed protein product [Cylindrotheca closterium]|uniref:Calcium/calmodulin-dependent protein kinase II association-domain domain-containing protein n=1 Tax=Cylindrotheca closterium TaxID=2856 RepID=A0AAD2FL26_9STRA|nr:unnamed protein product [Cylindrotheca closterium]